MAVTIATALCALALGFIVVTLYQMSDDSQSAADARQPATLSLSSSSGTVGTTVVARGTNFPRDAAMTLRWDGSATGMPKVQASRNGSFDASFIVPAGASAGRHRVSATGTRTTLNGTPITATVNAPFDVTAVSSVPTPTPVPPATPSFTLTASAAPTSLAAGTVVNVSSTTKSATSGSFLVDVQLFNPSGVRTYETWWPNEVFAVGQSKTYAFAWNCLSTSPTGTWTVKVGVFTNDWATLYSWNNSAATFGVTTAA